MAQLTPQQIIEARKAIGLPVPRSSGGNIDDIIARAEQKFAPKESRFSDIGQDIAQTKQSMLGQFERGADQIQEINKRQESGQQGVVSSLFQKFGAGAGTAARVIGDLFTGATKVALKPSEEQFVKGKATELITPLIESGAVQNSIEFYNNLKETNPELAANLGGLAQVGSLFTELYGSGVAKNVATESGKRVLQGTGKALTATGEAVGDVVGGVAKTGLEAKDTILKSLAVEADDNIKTILQRTPTEKFDEAVKIAEEATKNPEAITLFEKAGDAMEEATKQLDNQRKSIIQQKQIILNKAKTGLVEFKDATRRAILEVNKLGDSPEVKSIISKLKGVKYKIDADRVIDDIQNAIYTGNKTQVIPKGSTLDKRLRGIIGKYNNELKDSLPPAYRNLNTKASNRIKAIQTLNSSLGEVVDGVATRGASLIKQFFSPSGRKAKELFDYIKKNTGVDLAQDATLAKYMMEIFDDPRSRSLLEGIPTNKSGVINAAIDFAVEKTGVGKGVRESIRKQTLEKARDVTR